MAAPGSIAWLAGHELRLSWRDWRAMLTAGKKSRARKVAVFLGVAAAALHGFAYFMTSRFAGLDLASETANNLLLTGVLLLYFCLMVSQGMESATRVLYARADLDLLHSSPARLKRVFVVRLTTIAAQIALMAMLLAGPFINVAAWRHGAHWLAGYGVVMAMGAIAGALAIALTALLFGTVGARRTRFGAQVVAAVIGAMFVIGLQIVAIFTSDTLSHLSVLRAEWLVAVAPAPGSAWWWPARAVTGDGTALAGVLLLAASLLTLVVAGLAGRFVRYTAEAANIGADPARRARRLAPFRTTSPMQALRRKEWMLLIRDPWLISQSLMQLLYLLPPALLLWRSYGHGEAALFILVPVLVMAAGQLAGGLAWLAISGEDAPDLVATAPIAARRVIRAKVEAVLGCIALVMAPFAIVFATLSPYLTLVLLAGAAAAASSATLIQLWFRARGRRAQFHRRQTASRFTTFAEAFSSVSWAGTAAIAANGKPVAAAFSALFALGVLAVARYAAPKSAE